MSNGSHDGTTALARQQAQLAATICDTPMREGPFRRGDGLAVYRRNLLAVAEATLGVSYPTARRLLGHGQFRALVAELLRLHPPTRGDWGEWGEELPLLIERSEQGDKFPFIAPVAELDWLRHRANRAADNRFDPTTAQLLESHRVDHIGIGIARHVGLTGSIYPLVDILDWHADPTAGAEAMQVSEALRPVLVYRRELRVEQRYISPTDYVFLLGLRAGRSVGSLLDELAGQDFDFPTWVAQALELNLISNLYLIQENSLCKTQSNPFPDTTTGSRSRWSTCRSSPRRPRACTWPGCFSPRG